MNKNIKRKISLFMFGALGAGALVTMRCSIFDDIGHAAEKVGGTIVDAGEKAGGAVVDAGKQTLNFLKGFDPSSWLSKVLKELSVDDIKNSISTITTNISQIVTETQNINTAINAENGPIKRGKIIAVKLKELTDYIQRLSTRLTLEQLKNPSGYLLLANSINDPSTKSYLVTAGNLVVAGRDNIEKLEVGAIIQHASTIMDKISVIIAALLAIRQKLPGDLVRAFISDNFFTAFQNIGNDSKSVSAGLTNLRIELNKINIDARFNGILVGIASHPHESAKFINSMINFVEKEASVFQIQNGLDARLSEINGHMAHLSKTVNDISDRMLKALRPDKNPRIALCARFTDPLSTLSCLTSAVLPEFASIVDDLKNDLGAALFEASGIVRKLDLMLVMSVSILNETKKTLSIDIVPLKITENIIKVQTSISAITENLKAASLSLASLSPDKIGSANAEAQAIKNFPQKLAEKVTADVYAAEAGAKRIKEWRKNPARGGMR